MKTYLLKARMKRRVSERSPVNTLGGVPSSRSPLIAWRNSLICRSDASSSPAKILPSPPSGGGASPPSEGDFRPFAGQFLRSGTWDFGVLSCDPSLSPSCATLECCEGCEAGVVGRITDVPGVVRARAIGGGSGCSRSGTPFWIVHARNPSRFMFDGA